MASKRSFAEVSDYCCCCCHDCKLINHDRCDHGCDCKCTQYFIEEANRNMRDDSILKFSMRNGYPLKKTYYDFSSKLQSHTTHHTFVASGPNREIREVPENFTPTGDQAL